MILILIFIILLFSFYMFIFFGRRMMERNKAQHEKKQKAF